MKVRGVSHLLRWGFRVLFSDADVAFFHDPWPVVDVILRSALAFSVDDRCLPQHAPPEVCNCNPLPPQLWLANGYICTGFYFARGGRKNRALGILDGGRNNRAFGILGGG
eukprot:gene3369-biopygen6194